MNPRVFTASGDDRGSNRPARLRSRRPSPSTSRRAQPQPRGERQPRPRPRAARQPGRAKFRPCRAPAVQPGGGGRAPCGEGLAQLKQQHEAEAAQNRLLQAEADRLAAQDRAPAEVAGGAAGSGRGQAAPACPCYSAASGCRREPGRDRGGRSGGGHWPAEAAARC